MNEPHDSTRTGDVPSLPADSLDAGLAAGFGRPADRPDSVLARLRDSLGDLRPVLLKKAEGESAHIVMPKSDAMPPPEQTGNRYQLAGEIARGGMGAVLRGRDVDLGRDLAVKVLLEKHAHRPEVARRFIEEAQIGGQLQHPGVVPVYDIGRFGDRPFFTMKLVKGQTLAALLADRTDHAQDRPRLLDIALKVCQTLAYAHAKGVIHRDLKPANVMVGAFGEVQVMDWGLAKVLAEGGVADEERANRAHQEPEDVTTIRTARSSGPGVGTETEAGSLLGTPAYMPPEQANGDIANLDRRVDVFGLGALLCEILTGKPPYVGRSHDEVRRQAANGDLADARARLDGCGADTDLIALTRACLSPEAIDRPRDAQAVADGLTAYLDGVQERLRQAELAEAKARARAEEEVKRRRVQLALAASVLVLALIGGVAATWWWQARAATVRDVEAALDEVRGHLDRAQWSQARAALNRAEGRLAGGGTDALRERIRQTGADLAMVAELEEVRLRSAGVKDDHFDQTVLHPGYTLAFRQYGLDVLTLEPDEAAGRIRKSAIHQYLVLALDNWATYHRSENEQEANRLAQIADHADADAWRRKLRAPGLHKDVRRLAELAADPAAREQPPESICLLAEDLFQNKKYDEAIGLLRSAQLRHPSDFWINQGLGLCLHDVKPPRRAEAIGYYRAAIAVRPTSPGALLNLATVLDSSDSGQRDEVIACLRKAIELKADYSMAYQHLAQALCEANDIPGAEAILRKAVELIPSDAVVHNHLGAILADNKHDHEGAAAEFRRAIELKPTESMFHLNLGIALSGKGDWAKAVDALRTAEKLDPDSAPIQSHLGQALENVGNVAAATVAYRKVITAEPKKSDGHICLARTLEHQQKRDEAIATLRKAAESVSDPFELLKLGFDLEAYKAYPAAAALYRRIAELDPKHVVALRSLGDCLTETGDLKGAAEAYQKAIATVSGSQDENFVVRYGPEKGVSLFVYVDMAQLHWKCGLRLRQTGQLTAALTPLRRAHALGVLADKKKKRREPSAEMLRRTEIQVELDKRFAAFLNGSARPSDNAERLALADLCHLKSHDTAAVRFYAAAFASDPKVANDLRSGRRHEAACCAALAATGQGADAAKLDDRERTRLRQQALDWLRADLGLHGKQLETGQRADRAEVQQKLSHWQQDSNLAGLRDAAALARLPAAERAACEKLWADVAALLKKAEAPATKDK